MCTPELIIGTVISVAGTAISAGAQASANKNRQRAIEAAEQQQLNRDKQRIDNVKRNAEVFAPKQQGERLDQRTEELSKSFTDTLIQDRESKKTTGPTVNESGKSIEFNKSRAQRAVDRLKDSIGLARLTGRISAPAFAGFDANRADRNFVAEQGRINSRARGDLNTANQIIGRIQPNPAAQIIGGITQGIGGSVAGLKTGSLANSFSNTTQQIYPRAYLPTSYPG